MLPSSSVSVPGVLPLSTSGNWRSCSWIVAVTAGTQKSRLCAKIRIGSSVENAASVEPDTRCGHTAHAHARESQPAKSPGSRSSMREWSARNGHWAARSVGSSNLSRTCLASRW